MTNVDGVAGEQDPRGTVYGDHAGTPGHILHQAGPPPTLPKMNIRTRQFYAVLLITDTDLDPAFQVAPDSDTDPVQDPDPDIFFDQKLQFTYPQAFLEDVQATGETFSPQKRTSSTSKNEIY